jgi:hypothetical protein
MGPYARGKHRFGGLHAGSNGASLANAYCSIRYTCDRAIAGFQLHGCADPD